MLAVIQDMKHNVDVQRFTITDCENASNAMNKDGVVIIDDIFDFGRIHGILADLKVHHPAFVDQGDMSDYLRVGYRRYTAPLPFAAPFDVADIAGHRGLSSLLGRILGENFVFEALGIISSWPGAADQHLHCDGGFLFPDSGINRILSPSALTIVIPLVDMDSTSGVTAFWPGSHRTGKPGDSEPFARPDVAAGSIALWDFRVFHRGLANRGTWGRPLLYLTACRPF